MRKRELSDLSKRDFRYRFQVHGGWRSKFVAHVLRSIGRVFPVGRNRYSAYLLSRAGAVLSGNDCCSLHFPEGGVFHFPMKDKYWIKLLLSGYRYEPEVDFVIEELSKRCRSVLLVDCGSNFGYWIGRTGGMSNVQVAAIEPSPAVQEFLQKNIESNSRNVEYFQRAIWRNSDDELEFASSSKTHAGSAIANVARHEHSAGDWQVTKVKTIHIDAIVQKRKTQITDIVLLKLDVEGAEVDAIEGAKQTLASGDALLVYEDHAADRDHENSRRLLEMNMHLYCIQAPKLVPIDNLQQLAVLKRPRVSNYNFNNYVACVPGSRAEKILHEMATTQLSDALLSVEK